MRTYFLILTLLLMAPLVTGQDVKQDFSDGEFFLAQEEYEEALYTFTRVYNAGYQDNANINYRIGICLLQIAGRKTEAIPYLEKAVRSVSEKYTEGSLKETSAPTDAHVYLGNAYRINMEFEKSCEQYRIYNEYVGMEGDIRSTYAAQQILSCTNAVAAINNPVGYTVGNLGQVNYSHERTYNLVISNDMQTMAFMGKNPFYNGVYVSVKENGIWTKPYGINASIVSEGNMDVVSLSPDGKQMLLVIADEFDGTIYMSYYSDGRWNPAEALDKPINSRYYESHACFSPDGESIYFTSNRTESTGAMDIFRCDLKEDGSYGDAVNLGKNINTPLNEETPMISPDGKRIYFSSQGHSSMGGFDIFYSDMQVDGSWSEPVNLGYPLNTTDDDFALDPTGLKEPGQALIFANAGEAQHPLFKFEIIDENATPVYIAFNELAPEVAEVVEPEPQPQPEPQPEPEPQPVLQPEPQPAPVPVKAPEKYLIRPVFFEFDSNALTADTKAKLDETAGIMARFPSLQVEITGHTDAVGSIEYNQALSERRARAVADYLAANGLSAGRLKVTGKSESEHVALNRTRDNLDAPEGRKLNRRVQFRVSVTPEVIVEMEPILVPEHLKIVE